MYMIYVNIDIYIDIYIYYSFSMLIYIYICVISFTFIYCIKKIRNNIDVRGVLTERFRIYIYIRFGEYSAS